MSKNKEIPTLVKVLAILSYIGAGLCLLTIPILILWGGLISSALGVFGSVFSALGASIVVWGVIMLLVGAVLSFFIGRGLWKGKNWARILEIVFSALAILSGLYNMITGSASFMGIVNVLISGAIGGYLLFNKEAKAYFK